VATSRQALGVGGEQVFGLRPLPLPPVAASVAAAAASDAVSLFVQRAIEAMAWTDAGDHAAARRPAMEAVEAARRFGIPALSAIACYAAAAAIWIGERPTALLLVEESLALARAGAFDPILGFALSLAGVIWARNGDLPGALAALQEATVQLAGEGNRLGLGMTLERAAAVLVRLGEFEPAAVLAGADSARFALSVAAIYPDERLGIDEAQAIARRALGEAAYSSAAARGAAMNDDEVTNDALGQFRRVAVLIGEPGAQAPRRSAGWDASGGAAADQPDGCSDEQR
jgi:hypothetical protein